MALIKCPECGKEISDQANNCVNCGCPIKVKSNKNTNKNSIIFIGVFILVILIFIFITINNRGDKNIDNTNISNSISETINNSESETFSYTKSEIKNMITETNSNIAPYLEVLGADITNGNPDVSDDFINNLDSVNVMGYIGSVTHEYNTYDNKTIIEMLRWDSNTTITSNEFDEFKALLEEYFESDSIQTNHTHIANETWEWHDKKENCCVLIWFSGNKAHLAWDLVLEGEEPCSALTPQNNETAKKQTTTQKKYEKTCEECSSPATKTLTLFGQLSYLCQTHYDECMEIIGDMESDVGKGSASKHTCEQCSREGTHTYYSFTGQTEYYCTQHYEELKAMLDSFGLN